MAEPAPATQGPATEAPAADVPEQGPLILSDAKESDVCFDTKKELKFKTCICRCGGGIEHIKSSFETLEVGHDIKIARNFNKTKFELSVDGGEVKYKVIKKKLALPLTAKWHIYAGEGYNDRLCTIRIRPGYQLKVYFYEQPYPKRSDGTDHRELHSVVRCTTMFATDPAMFAQTTENAVPRGTSRHVKAASPYDGKALFDISVGFCYLTANVEPGVDYLLVMAIALVWEQTYQHRPDPRQHNTRGGGRNSHNSAAARRRRKH